MVKCPENWNKYKLNNIENLIKENPINKDFCIIGYYNITILTSIFQLLMIIFHILLLKKELQILILLLIKY